MAKEKQETLIVFDHKLNDIKKLIDYLTDYFQCEIVSIVDRFFENSKESATLIVYQPSGFYKISTIEQDIKDSKHLTWKPRQTR